MIALGDQAGFSIIEVLVAAVILALVAAGSAVALVGAVGTSGIQRNSSAAEALAQQDESKLRGYTVSQLANLNQTLSPVTVDGTRYTVQESASFVSDASGTPSCTNPSADYLETTSAVTWAGMPSSMNPVTVTGLITPTYGEISSSSGVLAVQVQDPSGNPIAGMPVSVSGPGTASGLTASNGCILFGDLPVGNTYTISVTPSSGSYVDAGTGQAVGTGSPDTQTNVQVSAGTTAASPTPFVLATPGAAAFSFTDAWPAGVAPTSPPRPATAPSVVLSSGGLTIICSVQDASGCPATGQGDTNWGTSAWGATNGQFTAQPLVPATYAAYAGICASDNPSSYGGSAATATVTAGNPTATSNPTAVSLTLPSIVVRLYSGTTTTPGSEIAMPASTKLVVTDTQCNGGEHYVGGPGVTVPANDSALPINSSPNLTGLSQDTGLLLYPGMPYGKYTVCYQNGTKDSLASITNQATGEIVKIYNGSLATGACAV